MLEPHQRARSLIGTPFRPQGRNPEVGLDCVGLVICAFDLPQVGLPTYRQSDGSWGGIDAELSAWFDEVETASRASNDLAVFELRKSFHFGVISGSALIHADAGVGRIVARRLPERLDRKCRLYRFRGVR